MRKVLAGDREPGPCTDAFRAVGFIVEMGHGCRSASTLPENVLVTALTCRRHQLARALVTQEVVARQDVVDLETLSAREALAHVALQETRVTHELAASFVGEFSGRGRPPARLAAGGRFHATDEV
jgi:hypothetical protein